MNKIRNFKDIIFKNTILTITVFAWLTLIFIFIGLAIKSSNILSVKPLGDLLFSKTWQPSGNEFGFLPFILGTVYVTLLSLAIAVPICVLTGIYLSEYAHSKFREMFRPVIDLLAGIPSVIYGLWGVIVIVPFIKNTFAPLFGMASSGYSILAGGIILAVMVAPVIINTTLEVLNTIPKELREASLAVGSTKWQCVKTVAFKRGLGGIIAGIVLALSRAFGETMAVLMVVGNVTKIPESVFDAGYTLPALIANGYGEMMSVPLTESALLFGSLVLMIIVLSFNIASRIVLVKIEEKIK